MPKLATAQVHHDFHIASSTEKKSPKGLNPIYLCHMSYFFMLSGASENKFHIGFSVPLPSVTRLNLSHF